jgi:hypothetical protein
MPTGGSPCPLHSTRLAAPGSHGREDNAEATLGGPVVRVSIVTDDKAAESEHT